jgi:hypothetical protein
LIISDVQREEQYAQRNFIKQSPKPVRFYAAIPLRAATGSVLGSLTIVDDAPRFGLSAGEFAFLEDVADTITQHLDAVVVRSQRQRSERLVQSLGLFVNGKSSLRQWWLRQEDSKDKNLGRHTARQTAEQRKAAGNSEFGNTHASSSSSTGVPGLPHDEDSGSDSDSGSQHDSDQGDGDPITSTAASLQNDVADIARNQAEVSTHDFGPATNSSRSPAPKLLLEPPSQRGTRRRVDKMPDAPDFDLETASRHAYSRAGNLIRQATSADGVVFVNANVARGNKKQATPSLKPESSDASDKSQTPGAGVLSDNDTSDGSAAGTDRPCVVEAYSTRDASSLHDPEKKTYRFDLSEPFLAQLIRR